MGNYQLEKVVWSDADFEKMGWHDATIHALAFLAEQFEFVLDLDYIFKWVDPVPPDPYLSFWVAPATLVFENVAKIQFEADLGGAFPITLQGLLRNDPQKTPNGLFTSCNWVLDANEGRVIVRATGFKQYIRRPPNHVKSQLLTLAERGGLGFGRTFENI